MTVREQVLAILKEVKPNKDHENVTAIVEDGYIDSFELMLMITTMGERFGVEISIDDITPENFNSVDGMVTMIEKLKG